MNWERGNTTRLNGGRDTSHTEKNVLACINDNNLIKNFIAHGSSAL